MSQIIGPLTTPQGFRVSEPWWEDLRQAKDLISMERISQLMMQVDQRNGKRSCNLTSQLNALILAGQITREEASAVQTRLIFSAVAEEMWSAANEGGGLGWVLDSIGTSFYIERFLGRKVSVDVREYHGEVDLLLQDLDKGYAAVIMDKAHARVAFKAKETEEYFVFDPNHPEQTGFYDPEGLATLQMGISYYIA
jgi:hypothetical protein